MAPSAHSVLAMLILTAVASQRLDWAKKGIVGQRDG